MGKTQEELAEMLGMSQEWVAGIENGRIEEPRLNTLRKVAPIMNILIEDLLIAARMASSRTGAQKLIEARGLNKPPDVAPSREPDWNDPVMQLVMNRASKLSPENLKRIAAVMEAMRDDDDD